MFFLVVFCLFFKNPLLSAGRMRFLKIKSKNKLDQFLTYKKGNLGPVFNFTAYIYIYIFIYLFIECERRERERERARAGKEKSVEVGLHSFNDAEFGLELHLLRRDRYISKLKNKLNWSDETSVKLAYSRRGDVGQRCYRAQCAEGILGEVFL